MKIICSDETSLVWIKTFKLLAIVSNRSKEGTFPHLKSGVLSNDTQSSFYNFIFPPLQSEMVAPFLPASLLFSSPQILGEICVCISVLKSNLFVHMLLDSFAYMILKNAKQILQWSMHKVEVVCKYWNRRQIFEPVPMHFKRGLIAPLNSQRAPLPPKVERHCSDLSPISISTITSPIISLFSMTSIKLLMLSSSRIFLH